MSKEVIVSAPGKIHFLGEHVVVRGKPALLTAVDMRSTVTLVPNDSQSVEISSRNFGKSISVPVGEMQARRERAQGLWEQFRDGNDMQVLRSITSDEMEFPIIAIGETLHYFQRELPSGISVNIDSEVPIGAGLGSSAATAVSVVAAMTSFLGEDVESNKSVINDIAFLVEQKRHGLPSGGDNAVVTHGGLIWFRKETPDLKLIQPVPFNIPPEIANNFVIIDTGRPKESTGEMIGIVSSLYKSDQPLVDGIFDDQERLTRDLLSALKSGNEAALMEIIKAGSSNLQKLGVVSPSTKALIAEIEAAGGVAKICGAGGSTEASGVMLSYHPDKKILDSIALAHNLKCYETALGAEGLRSEN